MAEGKHSVTASSLNVRRDPSLTGQIIGVLNNGDIVDVIGVSNDQYWYKVVTSDNVTGWASHKYLQPVVQADPGSEFPWLQIALAEVGVKEMPGSADNPRIVEYLHSTTLGRPLNENDETAWCSAFVNWCVERSGYEGTDSAWARDWLNWGRKIEVPQKGCVVVFKRGSDSGHVAFYMNDAGDQIEVLGGNQSDAVRVSKYPKANLLGFRVPGSHA